MPEDRWRLEVTRRGLAPLSTLLPDANCAGYDGTDWSDTTQILAPGDVYSTGLPNLLTVEDGQLGLYKGQYGDHVITPVLLGSSSGSTNWSAMTIIAPGEVDGALTLWARDNITGVIYSWPLTLDSNGVPELGTASDGSPVTATSGTVVGKVTLTSAAYPFAMSSGPLVGGTCGTSDLNACPGIYAEDTSGSLWYYEGESASGGASPPVRYQDAGRQHQQRRGPVPAHRWLTTAARWRMTSAATPATARGDVLN